MKKAFPPNMSSIDSRLIVSKSTRVRPIRHRTMPITGHVSDTERFMRGAYYATSTIHPSPRTTKNGTGSTKLLG